MKSVKILEGLFKLMDLTFIGKIIDGQFEIIEVIGKIRREMV
ncbi:hypothetical protein [Methanobrevibacter sp.]|nr:hypothetical protein [Methanobrevibacter sp.]MDO5859821.1 hypothetical protein [Methanobrevibacter sp.]